jgi:hypothetical protein
MHGIIHASLVSAGLICGAHRTYTITQTAIVGGIDGLVANHG